MTEIQWITDYLSENITDPVQKYVFQREILKAPVTSPERINAYDIMRQSKWYIELSDEQRQDGSWGRFHTQDSKAPKQKYVTTEDALRRSLQLSLSKDDPIIDRCIKLMERYVRGEETWSDKIEMHHDGGRSHLHSRPYITAAWINLFDPDNPVVKPKRDALVNTLKIALSKGDFDEEAWEKENRSYRGPCLSGWNAYPLMLLQNSDCMDDTLQRQYLSYIWSRKDGIYYLAGFPLSERVNLEDKRFYKWIYTLEFLTGFSLFPEFMKDGARPHLLSETYRLINEDVVIPASYDVRYADSWRDKNKRKTDLVLRLARILHKC